MGIDKTADKTPLLMNAEQNIGNSTILFPQPGSVGTVVPQTNPERLLNLSGGSAVGQTVTVVMTASRIVRGSNNPNPGFPGPITGIIEYGNGGRFTRIEFDVPVGPFAGPFTEALPSIEPQDGAIFVTVPTGVLRVYARYDNLLLAPLLGTNLPLYPQPMSQVEFTNFINHSAIPVIGPGGPLLVASSGSTITVPPEPVLIKAMVSYFTKTRSRVYKTLNCYLSTETTPPVSIQIGTPTAVTPAGYPGYAFYALPAYTKKVKVLRFPNTTGAASLDVLLHDGVRPVDYFHIVDPPASPAEFDIVGNESIIGINSLGNSFNMLKLVCEIGI
jgi:hypothetical protein